MERMAVQAQTVVIDVALAGLAFALAFFINPIQPELGFGQPGALGFFQLAGLYAVIAGGFAVGKTITFGDGTGASMGGH